MARQISLQGIDTKIAKAKERKVISGGNVVYQAVA